MRNAAGGFKGWKRVQRHIVWSAVSALIISILCCTSVVEAAASQAPASVNRTVPRVSPPVEMSFSSPPVNDEFLRTGLFAEPLAPVAETPPEENGDHLNAVFPHRYE